jgi:hypothetical protein
MHCYGSVSLAESLCEKKKTFLDVDPNDITDVEPEDEDAGFADIAGIAAEMHELDDLLEDDELCFDDGHFEQTTAVARQFI